MTQTATKEEPPNMEFLEIETKYRADNIDRLKFKDIAKSLTPLDFTYIESTDIYYVKSEEEFLRYRTSAENTKSKRAELAFKKKHKSDNNIIRTEVNLRVDQNNTETVDAFCQGLGYKYNFSIWKACDIYFFDDAVFVYYSVKDDAGKYASFIEIEVKEGYPKSEEQAWEIINKYEKLLVDLGISPQNRLKKSLYEMYRKDVAKTSEI